MIAVFCFSEDEKFLGIADRVHLFANEQDALDWQIQTLIDRGLMFEENGKYRVADDEIGEALDIEWYDDKLEALDAFQMGCNPLEFFHEYAIQDHRQKAGVQ